ncbi:MAG: hypothetical protein E7440_01345 [Ruminococcaceae bacterium]|nr:hypothetical protein [Oscillospiraceae bacterium]
MTPKEKQQPTPQKKERPHLLSYLVILFSAAFLLLLMSYFMQQRRNDQQVIDGLQQSMSAMKTTQNAIERNRVLMEENEALKEQLSALEEQAESAAAQQVKQEKTVLALDYLWRIEREYFQGRYTSARSLIRAFEEAGLEDFLPEDPISDPDYRSPAQQYESIYNLLF